MMYHCEKSVLRKCPNAFQRLVVEILYPIYIYLSTYLGIALNAKAISITEIEPKPLFSHIFSSF